MHVDGASNVSVRSHIGTCLTGRIPQYLAYRGTPGKPAGMLVFDVTLFSVENGPRPPAVPEDVAGAPADAEVTASGLVSKVRQGLGTHRREGTGM